MHVDKRQSRATVVACMLLAVMPSLASTDDHGAPAGGPADSTGPGPAKVSVGTLQYQIPNVTLLRQDGKNVSLPDEMNDGRPVVLNFIFTTCGSICPLMSQVFGQFQRKLGPESAKVHLMSISTDPEETRRRGSVPMRTSSGQARAGSTTPARWKRVRPRNGLSMCIAVTK